MILSIPAQKARLVEPVRRAAWMTSNELQTLLKAFLSGVEGPLASLAWQPDKPFTRLLQVSRSLSCGSPP